MINCLNSSIKYLFPEINQKVKILERGQEHYLLVIFRRKLAEILFLG